MIFKFLIQLLEAIMMTRQNFCRFINLLLFNFILLTRGNSYEGCGGKYGNATTCGHSVRIFCNNKFECSGGLVNSNYCWTARHCFQNLSNIKSNCKVGIGWNVLESGNISIINYYTPKKDLYLDVVILELEEELKSINIPKLILPPENMDMSFIALQKKQLLLCGWGKMTKEGLLPIKTKIMPITMLDGEGYNFCESNVTTYPNTFCAGVNGPEDGLTCKGDSGSNLWTMDEQGHKILIAILSMGFNQSCTRTSCHENKNGNVWVNVSAALNSFENLPYEATLKNGGSHLENISLLFVLIAVYIHF